MVNLWSTGSWRRTYNFSCTPDGSSTIPYSSCGSPSNTTVNLWSAGSWRCTYNFSCTPDGITYRTILTVPNHTCVYVPSWKMKLQNCRSKLIFFCTECTFSCWKCIIHFQHENAQQPLYRPSVWTHGRILNKTLYPLCPVTCWPHASWPSGCMVTLHMKCDLGLWNMNDYILSSFCRKLGLCMLSYHSARQRSGGELSWL